MRTDPDYVGVHRTEPLQPASHAKASCNVRRIVVESFIWLAWAILELVDALLRVVGAVWRLTGACESSPTTEKHVVIVGASFGGLAAQRELCGRRDVKVTLIDFKNYFEYTPGILRCFVQPEYLKELTCPLPASRNALLHGALCGASEEAVLVRDADGAEKKVPFDYLVLAVGSTYGDPIKPLESEPTLAERTSAWSDAAAKLAAAKTVIIVGAGPVGVEVRDDDCRTAALDPATYGRSSVPASLLHTWHSLPTTHTHTHASRARAGDLRSSPVRS